MAHYRIFYSYNARTAVGHTACVGDYETDAECEALAVTTLCGKLAEQYGTGLSDLHIDKILRTDV